MCPEPGIYYDVPDAEYRAWPCFHQSAASTLSRSPLHWQWEQQHPSGTEAMRFGSLVDTLIFEPGQYAERYVVRPATYVSETTKGRGAAKRTVTIEKPWNRNSRTCRAIWTELQASGKTIIESHELARAKDVAGAVCGHPKVAEWRVRGRPQVSMIWRDSQTAVLCKARLDLLVEPGDWGRLGDEDLLIADLKVTRNAAREAFRRPMTFLRYHYQAGLYQDGYSTLRGGLCPPFYLIAVEDEPPHGVAVYPVGVESLATGLKQIRRLMVDAWKPLSEGVPPWGYPVVNTDLDVLPYALDREVDFNV